MGSKDQPQPQEGAGTPAPEAAAALTAALAAAGETPAEDAPVIMETLPANVQQMIKALRQENAGHRQAKTAAQEAARLAEEARLEQEREFEKLAQTRQERIAELEPAAATAAKLTELIAAQINAEIANWPEEIKGLAPQEANAETMLAWVQSARPLAAKLQDPTPPAPGNGSRPRPAGPAGEQARQRLIAERERSFVQNRF